MCQAMEENNKKMEVNGAIKALRLVGTNDADIISLLVEKFSVTADYVKVLLAPKALAKNAAREDILKLLGMIDSKTNSKIADYVSSILHVSIAVNEELFDEIKGAGIMTDAIERVFKKEMDEKKEEAKEEIIINMINEHFSVDQIKAATRETADRIFSVAKKAGITALTL